MLLFLSSAVSADARSAPTPGHHGRIKRGHPVRPRCDNAGLVSLLVLGVDVNHRPRLTLCVDGQHGLGEPAASVGQRRRWSENPSPPPQCHESVGAPQLTTKSDIGDQAATGTQTPRRFNQRPGQSVDLPRRSHRHLPRDNAGRRPHRPAPRRRHPQRRSALVAHPSRRPTQPRPSRR